MYKIYIFIMMDTEANEWGREMCGTKNCVNNSKQDVNYVFWQWHMCGKLLLLHDARHRRPTVNCKFSEKHQFYDYPTDYYYDYYHCVCSKTTRKKSIVPRLVRANHNNNNLLFVQPVNFILVDFFFCFVLFPPSETNCSLCVNIRGDMRNQRADRQCE